MRTTSSSISSMNIEKTNECIENSYNSLTASSFKEEFAVIFILFYNDSGRVMKRSGSVKKLQALAGIIFLCGICAVGCAGGQTSGDRDPEEKKAKELSMEDLTAEIREAVRESETQITCTYRGDADKLNEQVNTELDQYLEEDYLCRNLLDSINIEWKQKGFSAEGAFELIYKDEIELPIVVAEDEDDIVKGMIAGWEVGKEKITVITEGKLYEEDEIFAMLDGAEINSATIPCEADTVYFEAYEPEEETQILKLWLMISEDSVTMQQDKEVLEAQIQAYGDEIRDAGYGSDEELYRAIYDKVTELAEYDDSIAVVTGMERLSLQMRVLRSAYGALVEGHTVCTGYARGYKALCDYLGLPCQVVVGMRDDVNHSWNRVRIGEELLYVDCTAGDTGSTVEEACLFTEEQMKQNGYIMDDSYVIPGI